MFNNLQVKTISNPSLLTYCKNYSKPKYIEFIEFFYNLGLKLGFTELKRRLVSMFLLKKETRKLKLDLVIIFLIL